MQQHKKDEKDLKSLRRSKRFYVTDVVTGRIKPTLEVRVVDISEHGMLVESPCGLPPAGKCELTLELPSGPRVIPATVARCRAQMAKQDDGTVAIRFHAGLEFTEAFAEGGKVLELMSEICTLETPAEELSEEATAAEIVQAM